MNGKKRNQLKKINDQIKSDTSWIAFRKVYLDLIKEKKIQTVFRPGTRTCGGPQGYCEGQTVKVRVIDESGANWANVPPKFLSNNFNSIKIDRIELKKIKDFKKEDFKYSTPDIKSSEMLKYHLGLIYDLSPDQVSDDSLATKISFSYIDN